MSGFAVIVHPHAMIAPAAVQAMASAMPARARLGTSRWHEDPVAMVRLGGEVAGTPCSDHQIESDGVVVVLDGWLANHDELAADLAQNGAQLRDSSGSEVLRWAWRIWGDGMLARLEGEFAFVLWDARRRELRCARDHQGLRPLFWHWDGARLAIASEVSGVLAALDRRPALNTGFLAEHMADEWYTMDETVWTGVMRLPQAQCLRLGDHGPRITQYWQLSTDVTVRYRREADYIAHYRSVLEDCVARAARSPAPVACEVSGGLDSSAIFAVADAMAKAGTLKAPGLFGVTLRGAPGTPSDEIDYARAVAQHLEREIDEVAPFLPPLSWYESHSRDAAIAAFPPNTVMLCATLREAADRGARVSLNGQGGDIWLDGAGRGFRESVRDFDMHGLAATWRAESRMRGRGRALRYLLRAGVVPLAPEALKRWFGRGSGREHKSPDRPFLAPGLAEQLDARSLTYEARYAGIDPDALYKLEKLEFPFNGLVWDMFAHQGARFGIESRYPMLARRFIEFAAATPDHIFRRGDIFKHVHREAMRGLLPENVRTRGDKAHFNQTFTWLLPEIAEWLDDNADLITANQSTLSQAKGLLRSCCNAAIDEAPVFPLWGTVAYAFILNHTPINGPPNYDDFS